MLGASLLSLHNITFFHRLMSRMRQAIAEGSLEELRERILPAMLQRYKPV